MINHGRWEYFFRNKEKVGYLSYGGVKTHLPRKHNFTTAKRSTVDVFILSLYFGNHVLKYEKLNYA